MLNRAIRNCKLMLLWFESENPNIKPEYQTHKNINVMLNYTKSMYARSPHFLFPPKNDGAGRKKAKIQRDLLFIDE